MKYKKDKGIKVGFIASSGGHLEEITKLTEIEKKYNNSFLVTENVKKIDFANTQYYVFQINRKEILFIFKFLILFFNAFRILYRERPDYIITTGALCSYPFCVVSKIFGTKVIYIESFARCDTLSLTGKLMRKKADLFIVQWEELKQVYPKAIFGGGIF